MAVKVKGGTAESKPSFVGAVAGECNIHSNFSLSKLFLITRPCSLSAGARLSERRCDKQNLNFIFFANQKT